jgi:hypothetical protein
LVENIPEEAGEKAYFVGREPFVMVGIPAFNEEKTIAKVIVEAQEFANKVVVCDDGSTDYTAKIAERLGANVIQHKENLGYGAAIKSLFKFAKESNADVLVTLDADGQHDPAEVPNVLTPIVNGAADIVVGSRFVDKRLAYTIPWYRRAGIKFITRLANNTSTHGVCDAQSGFRAYNRKSLELLDMFENGMGASVEILMDAKKQGFRICEVTSSCSYEKNLKASTHNPVRHGTGVVMSIIKLLVEDKPLQMLGVPGIICLIMGAIFGVWMLQLYAIEHQITTNIALASIAFILIGFFCLSTAITLYAISRLAEKTNKK